MNTFEGLELNQPILRALKKNGYAQPTPIQQQSIPALLEGRDMIGIAQTGTGKTAAFSLPVLDRLSRTNRKAVSGKPRALILSPTRELAGQIVDSIRTYGDELHLRCQAVFGGVPIRRQIAQLQRGVHILVATPGRLLDLMNQGHVELSAIEYFVLDEADRMLDMGFQRDIERITAALPGKRQTVLFSATMPAAVGRLAERLLDRPVRVEITPQATTVERIEQQVMMVAKDQKRNLLNELLADQNLSRVLIFTRTKHGADRVSRQLKQTGISSDAIHGNKAQNARQRALDAFRSGSVRALVATDIAARGIDVDGVTHVINFELPVDPEAYVHRIGRTARAGCSGAAISLCAPDERSQLRSIERIIRQPIPVNSDHGHHVDMSAPVASDGTHNDGKRKRNGKRRQRRRPGGPARQAA